MKYLILAAILTGCCPSTVEPVPPTQVETPPVPAMNAGGTSGAVDWFCQVEDVNESLVWASCDFKSVVHFQLDTVCINLNFYENGSGRMIASSRNVCSGPLPGLGTAKNYAAFIKEKRVALHQCGDRLQYCAVLAERNFSAERNK